MSNSIDFNADSNYEMYEKYADADNDLGSGFISNKMMRLAMSGNRHMRFMDSIRDTLNDLESDFKNASAELNAKIADCDDPVMKYELTTSLDELKKAWAQITLHPPGMHRDLGEFSQMWNERISTMRAEIRDSGLAVQASEKMSMIGPEALQISKPPQAREHQGVDASALVGSRTGGTGLNAMRFGDKTVGQMTAMMDRDPNALMDHLNSLESEDRQSAMQMIMKSLQDMNQMFSMMSNMMKSQHDTAKAAINNMRV